METTQSNICPITYEPVETGKRYSTRGLHLLSRRLNNLEDFPYCAEEQRAQARVLLHKLSVQGVQPKLSAVLNIKKQSFEICGIGGLYILKPQLDFYEQSPENEDLTMRLARIAGITVPLHGLLFCIDDAMCDLICN